MRKSAKNDSSSEEPDAAQEGIIHGGLNVRVDFKKSLKMHKKVPKRTYLTLLFMMHLKVRLLVQLVSPTSLRV